MPQYLNNDQVAALAERVRTALATTNRKQVWLATQLGLKPPTVSSALNGDSRITTERATKMAAALDLDISDLLTEPNTYVSAPMTTLSRRGLNTNHREVDKVLAALESIGLTPYWPGAGVRSKADQIDPRITAHTNFETLINCDSLILLFLHPVTGPSGALIELGFAIGQSKPVTVFIAKNLNAYGKRPFILDGLRNAAMRINQLAPIEIFEVESVDEVVELLQTNGKELVS